MTVEHPNTLLNTFEREIYINIIGDIAILKSLFIGYCCLLCEVVLIMRNAIYIDLKCDVVGS